MKICITLLVTLLTTLTLTAQQRKPLSGKVTSSSEDLEGIYIINKNTEEAVTTAKGGYFTIEAKLKDTLVFSAIQFIAKQVIVEQENLDADLFFVPLDVLVRNLDEIIINDYRYLNAESLGLVPKGQKRYTAAERKIYTATEGTDAIFNALSGRTKMLKTAAEFEKKDLLMEKINYIYTEEQIIAELKIPKAYVRGFVYYIVEDPDFAATLKSKNEAMGRFLINGLALKYLALISEAPAKADEK